MSPSNHTLQIGTVRPGSPVLLAPMAGYTDLPFRQSVRAITPHPLLAYSEMVEPHSILRGGGKKRAALLACDPSDQPLAWQLYGTDPAMLADGAQWLVENRQAIMLDINMGCPKRKIARRGAGAGLLLDTALALKIARRVVNAVKVPVSAKLRLGWEAGEHTALQLAPALAQTGLAALTIHGRTGLQGYAGRADRAAIRRIVGVVPDIPIIANGDINSPQSALAMREETGCRGVMIGRAALHNPWLIRDCTAALTGSIHPPAPTAAERHAFLRRHFHALAAQHGEQTAVLLFRRWIPQYSKNLRLPRHSMLALLQTGSMAEFRQEWMRLDIAINNPTA